MSFLEYAIHKWLMHKNKLPKFIYKYVPFLKKTYEQHTFLHHRAYYELFNYEPDPYGRDLDIELSIPLGMTLAAIVCAPLYFVWSTLAIVFFFTVLFHHLAWNTFHSEMHRPKGTWFAKTLVYKTLARHHWMHHTYPGKNYNVVFPLADFVMGAYLKPSTKDNERMNKLGF